MVLYGSSGSFSHSHGHHGQSSSSCGSRTTNACTDGDEFSRAVAKTAVAQVCEAVGFQSIQFPALETLADIAIRYLCDVGKASQFYANLAGRSQSNALDVVSAVEDIGGGGLADVHGPMPTLGTAKQLNRFVEYGEEIPFCKPVPHFPICKKRDSTPSFSQLGENPPDPHIPPWLPAFPDPHTYRATPVWNERNNDPRLEKLEQAKQRRKAERSLVSLHLRLCTSGASPPADNTSTTNSSHTMAAFGTLAPSRFLALEQQDNSNLSKPDIDGIHNRAKNAKRPVTSSQNPFLAPPLPPDAKEVSASFLSSKPPSPAPNMKNIIGPVALPSALEAFTPALEAARHDVQETGGASKPSVGCLPNSKERMPVLMTLDFGRRASEKAVAASLSLGGKDRKRGRTQVKDEEKDEKKRRAEQILAQSIEGSDDGVQ